MARIAGITIPTDKQVLIALTYIYGIGPHFAQKIIDKTGINPTVRVKDLTEGELQQIRDEINTGYTVEGELQRIVTGNIKRLKKIKPNPGLPNAASRPAPANRTRPTARLPRAKKATVGATKKK